jgi:hypothetical protein
MEFSNREIVNGSENRRKELIIGNARYCERGFASQRETSHTEQPAEKVSTGIVLAHALIRAKTIHHPFNVLAWLLVLPLQHVSAIATARTLKRLRNQISKHEVQSLFSSHKSA